MADDLILRTELLTALARVQKQVDELSEFAKFEADLDVLASLQGQFEVRTRRMRLIQNILDFLDGIANAKAALTADGYPNAPSFPVSQEILNKIKGQISEINIIEELFAGSATAISLDLDHAVLTNQPKPSA